MNTKQMSLSKAANWLWILSQVLLCLTGFLLLGRTWLILNLTSLRWLYTVPLLVWTPVLMQISTAALLLVQGSRTRALSWWLYAIIWGFIAFGLLGPSVYFYWRGNFLVNELLLATAGYVLFTNAHRRSFLWWTVALVNA